MDIVILPISLVSIIAICVIVGTLVIAYSKKLLITYALIFANFIVFVISVIFPEVIYDLGFRPIYLSPGFTPQLYTLFTSMFIHGGFLHIIGNMMVFFFVGMAFEQRVGWKKFLTIYILTGVCGALAHSLLNLGSGIVLIGASGAIFGIMGAFAFSYPRDEVVMPIPLGIIMVFRRIKVVYAVLIFAAMETVIVMLDVQDTTAHFAHIGGLVSGVVLAAIIIKNKKAGKESSASVETIYYDSYPSPKLRKINFSALGKLATNHDLEDELKRIENETVPQVRDVWLEHFLERTKCPRCHKALNHFDGKTWCEDCGFKINY
jgi:membrane associated rhomboid family serine protease